MGHQRYKPAEQCVEAENDNAEEQHNKQNDAGIFGNRLERRPRYFFQFAPTFYKERAKSLEDIRFFG